ncbi:PAS domain S-box protein [Methanoregula sp.]|uniref:PAS domain-containing sensor histidine kinase n=1 Tax=Methanoregula sp. TaxID=2052170 RepID=UPI002CDF15F6|nr:PAS domain S-box protein [Methanoregula sp.]HVP96079.1 PAS domain S-box protein [Methanoregula sp.]
MPRESESILRSFFDSSGAMRGIVEVIAEDDVRHIVDNAVTASFLGLTPEDMKNKRGSELGEPPDILRTWIGHYNESRKSGKPESFEYLDNRQEPGAWLLATVSYLGTPPHGHPRFAYVVLDITKSKRAESALRESEERLRFALEISHTGAWDLDLTDHIAYRSPEHDRIFGYPGMLPTWTYEMFLDHVLLEDRALVDAKFRHAVNTGGDWNFECRIRRTDGEIRWIWAAGRHQTGGSGTLGKMTGIVQDITERKQAEDALRESEERFRVIAETSPVLLSVSSVSDGIVLFTNPAYDRAFGFPPGEVIGMPAKNLIYDPAERDAVIDILRENGEIRDREIRVIRKDGTPFWISVSFARIRFNGNEAILGASVDVTDRRRAEAALRESEERYRTVADFTYDWEFWIDPDGRFIYISPSAEKILGRPISKYTSADSLFRDVTHPDDLCTLLEHMAHDLAGQGPSAIEFRIVRPDGEVRWIQHVCQPVLDAEGRFLGTRGSNRDTTERRLAEEALQKARDELESRVEKRTAELQEAVRSASTERQRLYDVLESLPAYVCLLDKDYRMPFANRYFRETFREPKGRRCFDFLFNRKKPCETCETYTVMKTRAPHHWYWTGPNGRDYDIYDFPFTDADGSFMILEMGIDITEQKKAEGALKKANAYNRSLIEASVDPLVTISPDGTISDVNEATIRVTGFAREELIGTDFSDYFTEPEKAKAGYESVFRDGSVTDYALEIRHRNGTVTPVLYNAVVYRDAAGNVTGVFAAARDVTEQRKAEEAIQKAKDLLEKRVKERTSDLIQSNVKLKEEISQRMLAESLVEKTVSELYAAIESTADGIYVVDPAGKIIRYNQNFTSMWKIPDELLQSGDDRKVSGYLQKQVKNPGLFMDRDDEYNPPRDRETYDMLELKDGRIFERYSKPQKMDAAIIGRVMSYRDVTDRRHAEEKLIASLQEKETLIREIHHRVKNNLQIISGLLDMTRMRTTDVTTNNILTDMMLKIKTMAQIHTRLYESKQFDKINMGVQIRDQVSDLSNIYGRAGAEISCEIDAGDIYLPVDQAIPCALVVNEILSNAFKHAFRGKKHGNLMISATQEDDHIGIIVHDDGVGIPNDMDVYRTTSLGFKLIRSLVTQLNGSVAVTSIQGTEVTVKFPVQDGGT